MKVLKFIKLFFILFPIAIIYGSIIAIITFIDYLVDKCKVRY